MRLFPGFRMGMSELKGVEGLKLGWDGMVFNKHMADAKLGIISG